MKSVIVTGATGFVGRALVRRIRERFPDCEVCGVGSADVDLSDRAQTFDWMAGLASRFDGGRLIHLAALYKAGDWPVRHPATQFHANMSININLLEAWSRFLPRARLTSILSYCMYPPREHPHPESELWGHEPEDYLFAYAMTKKALLVGQKAYARERGLASTSVVLPTVYGPGDSFEETSHVVGALIGKFVRGAREQAPVVEVWGDGTQRREFLYVEDAVDGILAAASSPPVEAVNLGAGQAHAVGELAAMIRDLAGFEGAIQYNTDRFVGVKSRVLDASLARERLDWRAATPIRDGLRQTVDWYADRLRAGAPA